VLNPGGLQGGWRKRKEVSDLPGLKTPLWRYEEGEERGRESGRERGRERESGKKGVNERK